MNATPVSSQAPIATDPMQISGAAPAGSANSGGKGRDFAATLSSVGAKPARRVAGGKAHGGINPGGQLPAPGNLSPPPAVPATAATASPAAGAAAASTAAPGRATTDPAAASNDATSPNAAKAGSGAAVGSATAVMGAAANSAALAALAQRDAAAHTGAPDASENPGAQSQPAAFARDGSLRARETASETANATGYGAAFAQALGLPAAPGATDSATAAEAATTGAAAAAKESEGVGASKLPDSAGMAAASKARAGSAAGKVTQSMGRMSAAANSAAMPAGSGNNDEAAPSVHPGTSTQNDPNAQTASATPMAAAANLAAAQNAAAAADSSVSQADDSAPPVARNAAQHTGRTDGSLIPPALATPPAAAAAAKAAVNTEGSAMPANAVAADRHARGGSGDALATANSDGVVGAAQSGVNAAASTDAAPTPTLKVSAGVETSEFGQSLADRVSWMVGNDLNGAKLQVNPAQLGPIEVRIAVQGGHAQVWLTSHSAVTRDALESSSPKLREMLGAQGFGQVSVDISQRSFQDRSSQAQPYDWTPAAVRDVPAAPVSPPAASLSRIVNGAVDAYA